MPIDLMIKEIVSDGLFKATGTFSNSEQSFKADVFIEKRGNELSMISTPEHPSHIARIEIEHITPHEPVLLDDPQIGTRLKYGNVHVSLKNPL